MPDDGNIHRDRPPATTGPALEDADAVIVALHGRGATAEGILQIVDELGLDGVAGIAPRATGNTWYPDRFTAPVDRNEPWLSAALTAVAEAVSTAENAGLHRDRIVTLGFSQGACVAAEFTARNATRYGGLVVFSGGLIGPPGTAWDYEGSLDGTPVYLGCGDRDPHIPVDRVRETAEVLERLGGDVTTQIFEGMGHTVAPDELAAARDLVRTARADP